ncbi:Uncharacterised protein [BD1-7 clade bacterium]|uniref:Uncharacterized protein n=1 Tax=BD1-7 clade bacterium TaxID=2029982 RepID=A0A5S9NJD1_9GAMM|nr:Uncharacterised protein [BD1-7 clade bacterium]CAA0093582.1 Uncharacterised protein [BD1-7 clade bacterium]
MNGSLAESLSKKHRSLLISSLQDARYYAACSLIYARQRIAKSDYQGARKAYYHALEAANILLDTDPDNPVAERRFANTATELTYLLMVLGEPHRGVKLRRHMVTRFRALAVQTSEYDLIRGVDSALSASGERLEQWLSRFDLSSNQFAQSQTSELRVIASRCA